MWKYNFKCAQFCFWKKIGTAMASTLKSIQKQSNIITHVEQWQKSNKLMWHWRLMWDECNSETQLPYSDFKAQIILRDSWPSQHAIECQPTCQLICRPMHWPTYQSSVQQHVNRQSTDMAIKSRSTYWPIVPNRTRLRGAQIMQDPRFVQIVNANPGRNVPVLNFGYQLPKSWTNQFAHVNGKQPK